MGVDTPSAFASFARRCGGKGVRERGHDGVTAAAGDSADSGSPFDMFAASKDRNEEQTRRRTGDSDENR